MEFLTALSIGMLFAVGIFQVLRRNLIRSAIGLILLTNAVNLFLLAAGAYHGVAPAYVSHLFLAQSDALPQALILTAIVISMGATAFIFAVLVVISGRYRTSDSDAVNGLKR
jgi:multicomponent Na+:H+ antiporter subunit C